MGNLWAIAGSVGNDNPAFTGFTEMLTGIETRKHGPTLAGRGGAYGNILPGPNRMAAGARFPSSADFSGVPEDNRIPAFISAIFRHPEIADGTDGRFIIHGGSTGFPTGVYTLKKKKKGAKNKAYKGRFQKKGQEGVHDEERYPHVTLIQKLGNPFKKAPRKFDWTLAALKQIKDEWISEQFHKNLEYILRKLKIIR